MASKKAPRISQECCLSAPRLFACKRTATYSNLRSFSRTARQAKGVLPRFEESSSTELDSTFSTIRSKYLIPLHLNKEQKRLVFEKKNWQKLELDGVSVTIGGEVVPLEPIDMYKDIPRKTRIINAAINAAKEAQDWRNIELVLEGFKTNKVPLKEDHIEKIIRKLCAAGQEQILWHYLNKVKRTGMSLRDRKVASQIFLGIWVHNARSGWDKDVAGRTMKTTKQIINLMAEDEHCGKTLTEGDSRRLGCVMALPLQLSIVLASVDDIVLLDVETYAGRLTDSLKDTKFYKEPIAPVEVLGDQYALNRKVLETVPVWYAIKSARELLGSRMPNDSFAKNLQKSLGKQLETATEALGEKMQSSAGVDAWRRCKGIA